MDAISERFTTTGAKDCSEIAAWSEEIGWDVDYQQVGRGAFDGAFSATVCGDIRVTQQYCSRELAALGAPPKGMVSILLPSYAARGTIISGRSLGQLDACVMAPNSEGFLRSPAHLGMCTVSVPIGDLEAALWRFGRYEFPPWLTGCHITRFPQRVIVSLMRTLSAVTSSIPETSVATLPERPEDTILQLMCAGICTTESTVDAPSRTRYFVQARDFIHARYAEALSVGEVAEAVGVSRRTMEMAFREVADTTVAGYIRTLRLNRARTLLLERSTHITSVSDAAAQCGLMHFGYFSRDYKRLFGELPSHTLGHN